MAGLLMTITDAGLDALVDAQNGGSDDIKITKLGLTSTIFVQAPTLTALPGQFKLIDAIAGEPVSETIIHMTAYDTSDETYNVTGFGLFLEDGTLFAVYSAEAEPVLSKAQLAFGLFSYDISFDNSVGANITFGSNIFSYPPASESAKGVAKIATTELATLGEDDQSIITPLKLKELLDVVRAFLNANGIAIAQNGADITSLNSRTITGSGLVTGGGNLSANRILAVAIANAAAIAAETADNSAVTPLALASLPKSLNQNGYCVLPGCAGLRLTWGRFTANANGTTSVVFPLAYSATCFSVVCSGTNISGVDAKDNPAEVLASTISATGFSVFSADDESASTAYFAIGI
ncbi:gp53-like domain-containing protein [Parasphingorhabdus sp.]|uniref:gp53-like domain-containing protein n=1 Tax=Parasphingorhabdus sp. TaxID=2709688 RepID=UPI002F94E330